MIEQAIVPEAAPVALPVLGVTWNPETQSVGFQFDAKEFKTWEFVGAVLGMATDLADHQARAGRLAAIQQAQQAEAQQALRAHTEARALKGVLRG